MPRLKTCAVLFFAVGLTFALMGATDSETKAPPALLDPSKIGSATKKNAPAPDLLDPSKLGGSAGAKSGATPSPPSSLGGSGNAGRSMAGSVVTALNQLTADCAGLVRDMEKLMRETQELSSQLSTLQRAKDEKMAEYRNGLFCSGCDRTKSEILATGSTFPHPGRHIISPTPEQIAAKERELQAPIDRLAQQRRSAQDKYSRTQAERDEALLQIQAGCQLWVTSVSYQHALIAAADRTSEERYQKEHRKAEAELGRLLVEVKKDDEAARAEHQQQVDRWTAARRKATEQRASDQHQTKIDYARAGRAAREDCDNLNGYFNREDLRKVLSLVLSVSLIEPRAGFTAEGGLFRMGNHDTARHDEVLSSVRDFIARFDAMPPTGFRVVNNFVEYEKPALPTPPPGIISEAKKLLKDYAKDHPPEGATKPKRTSDPGGIRN